MAKKKAKKDKDENLGGVTNGFNDMVAELFDVRDRIKELYKQEERLMDDILSHKVKPGVLFEPFATNEDHFGRARTQYTIKDNFADTNIIFRSCAAKRFDIVEVKAKKGKK